MRAITKLRRERGFGGQDGINRLAKLAGLAPSTIATILSGRGACLGTALHLAKILECDPLLLSGNGKQSKSRAKVNRQPSLPKLKGAATPMNNNHGKHE